MAAEEDDVLLQARIGKPLYDRYAKQRERWGWSNKEALERMLENYLPVLEESRGPPLQKSDQS